MLDEVNGVKPNLMFSSPNAHVATRLRTELDEHFDQLVFLIVMFLICTFLIFLSPAQYCE